MSLCEVCVRGMYADTYQCALCWEDLCNKETCVNSYAYTCSGGCENTWCDVCVEEIRFCDFCEKCESCDPSIIACTGCLHDENIIINSRSHVACAECRIELGWTTSANFSTGEFFTCCPDHPRDAICFEINNSVFKGSPQIHPTLAV